jgi:hypothetical protein
MKPPLPFSLSPGERGRGEGSSSLGMRGIFAFIQISPSPSLLKRGKLFNALLGKLQIGGMYN